MTYLILSRKYRPQIFDEVVAQKHITETLKNSIKTKHVSQAFLFTGPRGVGKTSMARILAKALNCEKGPTIKPCNNCKNCKEITNSSSVDVVEIDGASHTSVNDIRQLQNELIYPPQNSNYKIYIIDEVHMLSKSAFNALLKTLEEPPENVKFVFATTEPHKVIPTIVSRCQRYDFHRIPIKEIVKQINSITPHEKIKIDDQAIFILAKKADGSMRDALSLVDQIIAIGKKEITKKDVLQVFGIVDEEFFHLLIQNIIDTNNKEIIENFHQIISKGNDINEIVNGFIEYLRNLLMLKIGIIPEEVHEDNINGLSKQIKDFSHEDLVYAITIVTDTKEKLKTSSHPFFLFETTLLKLANLKNLMQLDTYQNKVSELTPKPISETRSSKEIEQKKTKKLKTDTTKKTTSPLPKKEQEKPQKKIEVTKKKVDDESKKIIELVKEEMPFVANYLSNAELKSIRNNFLHYETKSMLSFKYLKDNSQKLADILSEYFGTKLKIDFQLIKNRKKKFINNPTIKDIQRESPRIADMIKKIDGYIISQKRNEKD